MQDREQLSAKELKKLQDDLDAKSKEIHAVEFSKLELTIIFNELVKKEWTINNARYVIGIIDKIEPIVAQDSNIKNGVVTD
jgi:hypothetical protein